MAMGVLLTRILSFAARANSLPRPVDVRCPPTQDVFLYPAEVFASFGELRRMSQRLLALGEVLPSTRDGERNDLADRTTQAPRWGDAISAASDVTCAR
jgi:hypothetical protein